MASSLRSNLLKNFKSFGSNSKRKKSLEILGCSFEDFKNHIELQFESWMSWENRGNITKITRLNYSWDLDHIIPLSTAKTEEDLYLLNHWSNFQPLCSFKNRYIKKAKMYPVTNLELKITVI